jgi:high affinity Mn2+ porin
MKTKRKAEIIAAISAIICAMTAPAMAADTNNPPIAGVGAPAASQQRLPDLAPTNNLAVSEGKEQTWNWHIQNTEVVQGYPGFPAKYTNPGFNSLPGGGETRETVSLDVMAGVRLWKGAEAHIDGLMWQGFGLNDTLGLEAVPNGEAYRLGTALPNGTFARLFIRQTIGLGGEQEDVPDSQLTLAGKQDVSRLTFTLGRMSAGDIFDQNTYANAPRTQFMNWGLVNNEAWDYAADAVGFDTGFAVELNLPKWTLRYGFFQVPNIANNLTGDDALLKWPYDKAAQDEPLLSGWAMVTELERRYTLNNHPGAIRFLAFLNRADMFSYNEATAILQANGPGADLTAARAYRLKYGFGLNWEQEIAKNAGLFSRLGWNDGQEQGWMFTDVDYAATLGLSVKGESWHRPNDTFGLAGIMNGITHAEQAYFAAGGTGIEGGDGNLNYGWEKGMETYYNFQIWKEVHFTLDYQFIANPAFNRDRGPVSVFGARFHWEF